MNIPEMVSVECSEYGNPKGPLPRANLNMSGRSPRLSSEGSGKSYDDKLNTLGVCSVRVEQSMLPYLSQPVFPTGQAGQASVKPGPACPNSLGSSLARACRPG